MIICLYFDTIFRWKPAATCDNWGDGWTWDMGWLWFGVSATRYRSDRGTDG